MRQSEVQSMRRFEFAEESSNKFWEVTVSDNTLTVRFGRIGRLYFFIREQDLKARDFSKVWVNEQ